MTKLYFRNPLNPLSQTALGRNMGAYCELFERMTRRYGKPSFDIDTVSVDGQEVSVHQKIVWSQPFCNLIHFEKSGSIAPQPKLLVVAPMSGHYATLLRGTVEDMLPNHDVYVTDWIDARMVPLSDGQFDLDDYIDYIINMMHRLGGNTHIMAVCQPSVPVLAAAAVMAKRDDPYAPLSMTLMGGPIDTRENPTAVNLMAQERGTDWFRNNVISTVPFPHTGFMRPVYPGFLQLTGFMSMNLDRHMSAHRDFFQHLIDGDGDSAEKHTEFYDEYMAVMDLTAEFYLQTVEEVFVKHSLPDGKFLHRDQRVDCSLISKTALMTVEGERDDISGLGQTKAAHKLCSSLPDDMKVHYMQPRVGHYGVFNGSRFRSEIAPRISDFILSNDPANRMTNGSRSKPAQTRSPAKSSMPAKSKLNGSGSNVAVLESPVKQAPKTKRAPLRAARKGPFLAKPVGKIDDLTAISGIGPKFADSLKDLGVFHYDQIAGWSKKDIEQVDAKLAFKGRIVRDKWISQAKALSKS